MDNVIPVALLVALTLYLAAAIPNFISVGNITDTSRQIGEFGLIVIGMTIVMLAGGIDLSVGSNFALANVTALALINVAKWPVEAAIAATLGVGALVGLINGFLIGFLRLRAFLTTLVMLTLIRAVVDLLLEAYSVQDRFERCRVRRLGFRRRGSVLGVPFSFVVLIVIAIIAHFVLTRLRIGWRIMAVGGSRRAAYNAGIPVRAHGMSDLRCFRRAHQPRRHALCGAAFGRRPGHRRRARAYGGHGGAARRQQRRRRPRLDRQGPDGRHHRLAAD